MAWVPQRRGFRLAGRVVLFSVFDVTLMTGLPAMGELVQFNDKGGRVVRQRMAE